MTELEQMLRVQARLHTLSGANALGLTFLNAANRIAELEALCKECADYIDINGCSDIGHGSKLHRDLRKQAGDL